MQSYAISSYDQTKLMIWLEVNNNEIEMRFYKYDCKQMRIANNNCNRNANFISKGGVLLM